VGVFVVERDDPIRILIRTVLSLNTSDVQALKARERIKDIPVEDLHKLEDLEDLIRPAGLPKQKAATIREISRRAKEIRSRLSLDTDELRRRLMSIKGIGPKTADLLLIYLGRKAFPIDTHIKRVASRLGWGRSYNTIRNYVLSEIDSVDDLFELHKALISLGRSVCKPRPKCEECPLRDLCPRRNRLISDDGGES
jgi:endonuclease-3